MMNREEFFYLLPYVGSLALSLGVFIYTWRHRHVRGARVYAWFTGGQSLTLAGFLLELVSPNLQTKLLWDKFQWLTDSFLVFIPFLIFAVQFSEHKLRRPRLTWGYWIGTPIVFTLLVLTDSLHHLVYPNPHLSADYPFPDLQYDFTMAVYLYVLLYIYAANFYGIGLLIKRALEPHNLYRLQYWTMAIGFLIPLVLSFFSLANIRIAPQRDISPFSFAIGNLVVAWGLFRYRLFDIVPIARERIFENMIDPVVVLDAKNRVVDMNAAALTTLGRQISEVVGRSSSEVFANWPIIVSELEYLDAQQREIAITEEDYTFFHDLNISAIYNDRHQLLGRVIVARDITKHKTLEAGYRFLSQELEQRVLERTEELRKSAEQYRAVVENQTEFIVRWKADGVRTFVNEAYCRYFGVTPEQAIGSNFLELVAEEDRHALEAKIARLQAGVSVSETEVHRVIKPDGTLAWQEWTDQAIRDEAGNIIEFQSVGRDVTERKLAEEGLLKQLAFDELMTGLLTRFATCAYDQVDASVQTGLKEIAELVGAERSDLLLLSKDEASWIRLHAWHAPELPSVTASTHIIPMGRLAWSDNKLLKDEVIKIITLDDYPPEAEIDRRFTESEGVRSLLSVRITGLGGATHGRIDLISYTRHIAWSDSDVTHLRMVGDAIANTLERKSAEKKLADAYDTTLEGWAKALELRDKETEGHSRRVTETTVAVAHAMGFNDRELIHIRRGSILHDIGKMGIPDDILRKNGDLTEQERIIVNGHPITALNLLKPIAYLQEALDIPYCHHEKWDGTGYPRGLKGEEIPLSARIFAVVDVWDALSSDRPYRDAWPREKIEQYLLAESGKHFDPNVVGIFLKMVAKGEI